MIKTLALHFMLIFSVQIYAGLKSLADQNKKLDLCKELHSGEGNDQQLKPGLLDFLRVSFAPETLIDIDLYESIPEQFVNNNHTTARVKTNYIFLLRPSGEILDYSQLSAMESRYGELKKNLIGYKHFYNDLKRQESLDACQKFVRQNKKKYDAFSKISISLLGLDTYRQYLESETALKLTKKAAITYFGEKRNFVAENHFEVPLEWKIIKGLSPVELKSVLNSQSTGHVIILAHADSQGRLYDERNKVLHKTFFNKINSEVLSLNIFSCYSDKVLKHYNLNSILIAAKRPRFFSLVKSTYKVGDFSLLNTFPAYINEVEKTIMNNSDFNPILETTKIDQSLKLQLDFAGGARFVVIVNGNYLTETSTFLKKSYIEIPFFYLNSGKNEIALEFEGELDGEGIQNELLRFRNYEIQTTSKSFSINKSQRYKIYFNF